MRWRRDRGRLSAATVAVALALAIVTTTAISAPDATKAAPATTGAATATGGAADGPSRAYAGDFPDPFLLRVGGTYYAYATQNGFVQVQTMSSTDLVHWSPITDALPLLPAWAEWGRTWAPAVLARPGRPHPFVLYYTTKHHASGRQCISVATADAPQGPFTDTSAAPLICQLDHSGSIDPHPFVDADGTAYLHWKGDDNATGGTPGIWGARLAADGLALTTTPTLLLTRDRTWEQPLVEGPAMTTSASGAHLLFYGAGWWEAPTASIGYATCAGPLGPCTKPASTADRAWLVGTAAAPGPAGPSPFTGTDGQARFAYHAWPPGAIGYATGGVRTLWVSPLTVTADGAPLLGSTTPVTPVTPTTSTTPTTRTTTSTTRPRATTTSTPKPTTTTTTTAARVPPRRPSAGWTTSFKRALARIDVRVRLRERRVGRP